MVLLANWVMGAAAASFQNRASILLKKLKDVFKFSGVTTTMYFHTIWGSFTLKLVLNCARFFFLVAAACEYE